MAKSPAARKGGPPVAVAVTAALALLIALLSPGVAQAAGLTATVTKESSWDNGYSASVTVRNDTSSTVSQWEVVLTLPGGTTVAQVWNAQHTSSGNSHTFTGVSWNSTIPPGGTASFGFIASGSGEPTHCTINGAPCDEGSEPGGPGGPGTPSPDPGTQPGTGTPVERYGKVQVCGTQLCDEHGNPVQLRGMSTHGIQWFDHCLTDSSLDALAYDWKADIIRLSMYIQEDGYETNPRGFTDRMHQLIDMATARGLYVIVDWHILTPGDPHYNLDRAKTFFAEIAQRHASKTNVLYEIANEPNGVSWASIKSYAEEVIPVIRQRDPDSVIIVGTRGWSSLGVSEGSGPAEIAANPVNASNIMYAFHFYAASHRDNYLNALREASELFPVFVTEFGTETYTGDGANDFQMADRYIDLMAERKIGWTKWNYSDDFRSGAVFQPGTCASGGPWIGSSLKASGQWVRSKLQS
jgi:endoglucanase